MDEPLALRLHTDRHLQNKSVSLNKELHVWITYFFFAQRIQIYDTFVLSI